MAVFPTLLIRNNFINSIKFLKKYLKKKKEKTPSRGQKTPRIGGTVFIFYKYNYLSIKENMSMKEAIPSSLEAEFQKPHPLQAVD